jgi:DNA-binding transcriptional MerR regulator
MRMAELSARSGVSVPTIKFYRHEGLVPPGRVHHPNQVEYGPDHVRRLRLVRLLTDLCGLQLSGVRTVLDADGRGNGLATALSLADNLSTSCRRPERGDPWKSARISASAVFGTRGWQIRPESAALDEVADMIVGLRAIGRDLNGETLAKYAGLAEATVTAEMRLLPITATTSTVDALILITAVYERLFAALRRLAREDWTRRYGAGVRR